MARNLPVVASQLPVLSEDELAALEPDERHAEAWYLSRSGWSQAAISTRMGVSRKTVQNWLALEMKQRLSRREQVDEELEHIAGTYEAVIARAWEAHRISATSSPNSLAGSNYLRLVVDAAAALAHIKGIDGPAAKQGDGKMRVVVRIGGADGSTVELGAEST